MILPWKMFLVLLTANLTLTGSSTAASTYKRKPDTINHKVTIPVSPTTDQHPSPNPMARSQASTYKTFSTRESPSRFKRSHQSDASVAANPGDLLIPQHNDTIIAGTVDSSAAQVPPSWPAWLPTLGTVLNSVVHIIIMILGVLNISINPRVHAFNRGRRHDPFREGWPA